MVYLSGFDSPTKDKLNQKIMKEIMKKIIKMIVVMIVIIIIGAIGNYFDQIWM